MKHIKKIALAFALMAGLFSFAAERVDFSNRPLLAGRASLTEAGYVESRILGVARLSPELTMPIELVYESSSEKTGAFGFAWCSPQLESSAVWDKDGMLWTSPWGEKVKFFPKNEKTPKDAVKIAEGRRQDRCRRGGEEGPRLLRALLRVGGRRRHWQPRN